MAPSAPSSSRSEEFCVASASGVLPIRCLSPQQGKGPIVLALGIILLLLDMLVLGTGILSTIGWILIVVGAILLIIGALGRTVGPRRFYW